LTVVVRISSPPMTATMNGVTQTLRSLIVSATARTTQSTITTEMLPSCVTALRTCIDVADACLLPHFATLLSIPVSCEFVRTRYASAPNSTPPPIAKSSASVSASPVATAGSSRASRAVRSLGCLPTVSPTVRAVSSAGDAGFSAIRG